MGIKEALEGKRAWRAHMARVRELPADYQVVYDEVQKYLFKVGAIPLVEGNPFEELVEFFENGAFEGKRVSELIGPDVAGFADDLMGDTRTYVDEYNEKVAEKRRRRNKD